MKAPTPLTILEDLRGLSFTEEDAGEGELQCG